VGVDPALFAYHRLFAIDLHRARPAAGAPQLWQLHSRPFLHVHVLGRIVGIDRRAKLVAYLGAWVV
jgi:hypothetical protein